MILFACPKCQTPLQAPEWKAGDRVRCPRCAVLASVPRGVAPHPPAGAAPAPDRRQPDSAGSAAAEVSGNRPGGMVRFSCPACGKHLKVADHGARSKVTCPGCGQRLQVPSPAAPPARDKTLLGSLLPPPDSSTPAVNADSPHPLPDWMASAVPATCPGCGRAILLLPHERSLTIQCGRCGTRFGPAQPPAPPPNPRKSPPDPCLSPDAGPGRQARHSDEVRPRGDGFGTHRSSFPGGDFLDGLGKTLHFGRGQQHSGLGMASFIIALLVGGLEIIVMLVVALNIAHPAHYAERWDPLTPEDRVKENVLGGAMAITCLSCMSVPLCLVGAGLAFVALVGHRDRNHLFTWIGLLGNGAVVLAVVGLYVLAALLPH